MRTSKSSSLISRGSKRDYGDARRLRPRNDPVEFLQGDHFDLWEAAVPAAHYDLGQEIDGTAVVGADGVRRRNPVQGIVIELGPPGQGQGQVAVGLRLLGPQVQHPLEGLHGQVQLPDLLEPVSHHPQQGRLLQLQFGDIAEDL